MNRQEEMSVSLARAVETSDRRRAAAWLLRFRIVSALILVLLATFIAVYLNVEIDFLSRVAPFIVGECCRVVLCQLLSGDTAPPSTSLLVPGTPPGWNRA